MQAAHRGSIKVKAGDLFVLSEESILGVVEGR